MQPTYNLQGQTQQQKFIKPIKEQLDIFSDPVDKDIAIDDFFSQLDDSPSMMRRRRRKRTFVK